MVVVGAAEVMEVAEARGLDNVVAAEVAEEEKVEVKVRRKGDIPPVILLLLEVVAVTEGVGLETDRLVTIMTYGEVETLLGLLGTLGTCEVT